MNNQKFFYCYNPSLKNFLKFNKGINFLCHGLSPKTLDPFWQFAKSEYLQQCLDEYREHNRIPNNVQKGDIK